jgi:GGDEF domain-containing protein
MSQQGPILVISGNGRPSFAAALDEAGLFPIIDADWSNAVRAASEMQPAAVVADMTAVDDARFVALAQLIGRRKPYLPLIAVEPEGELPDNALPLALSGGNYDRLIPRLRAALRVRALNATVLRRLADEPPGATELVENDPALHATVLLIGRGGCFPALSVALGERAGVVGAFSIEAAAQHLANRDIDGVVISEGFTTRVVDAFLTVLSEDARFRHLPVVLTSDELAPSYELPNLEIIVGEPEHIAANTLPLVRQHALEAQLTRSLRAIEAKGLIDPQTGLLTPVAFERDYTSAVNQTLAEGGGLAVARFAFDPDEPRAQFDGARIISRLMRKMDFGAARPDGSVIVVFSDTDLRNAHAIARRLSAVMRHTSTGRRGARNEPVVTVAALGPKDSAKSLLGLLYNETQRAAS